MAVTLTSDKLVPATSNVTVPASLSYVMSSFWTVMLGLLKHVENPDVVKVPADTIDGSNKERADNSRNGRNMMLKATNALEVFGVIPKIAV